MAENHLDFVYQIRGEIKEIDVFKLAPTLLALGELIQDSNRELNREGPEIAVNVKPFREGSFIVDLILFQSSNIKTLLDFLTPHSLEQLKTLLECIGLVSGGATGATIGAVKAMKYLGSKPKTAEEVKPGEFRLTTADDRSITVDRSTHVLLQNSTITNNILKIYREPLESQLNATSVATYLRGVDSSIVTTDRGDIPAMKEFVSPSEIPPAEKETVKETVHNDVYLNPKRGAFGDDPKDWSFYRGEEVITATIRDKEFLQKYVNGEIRLNQSDLLTVDLLERQRVKGTLVQKPTYEVLKVKNYEKGYTQSSLL